MINRLSLAATRHLLTKYKMVFKMSGLKVMTQSIDVPSFILSLYLYLINRITIIPLVFLYKGLGNVGSVSLRGQILLFASHL